jgi:heme/copper-type cytochrome/quinol oxidase subunit 2
MPVQKKYCGLKEQLPQGYTRFGNRYECMKTGYGTCLYGGKKGEGQVRAPPQQRTNHTVNYDRLYIIFMVLLVVVNIILIIWIFMIPKHNDVEKQKQNTIKNTAVEVAPSIATELLPLAFL